MEEDKLLLENDNLIQFFNAVRIVEDDLWIGSYQRNILIKINLTHITNSLEEDFRYYHIDYNINGFMDLEVINDTIYLLPHKNGHLLKYNYVTGITEKLLELQGDENNQHGPQFSISHHKNQLILTPLSNPNFYIYNLDATEQNVKEISLDFGMDSYKNDYFQKMDVSIYFMKKLTDEKFILMSSYDNSFFVLNEQMEILEKIPCRVPKEYVFKTLKDQKSRQKDALLFYEAEGLNLILDYLKAELPN